MAPRFIGWPSAPSGTIISVTYVTPEYFQTFRIPPRGGRVFTTADTATCGKVIIVNEAFLRRYARGDDPIGRRLSIGAETWTIVGVVGDILQRASFGNFGPVAAIPAAYAPATQVSSGVFAMVHTWFSPSWVLRTSGATVGLAAAMQRSVASVDPQLPFATVRTVADVRSEAVGGQRAIAILLGSLAALAVLLAAIGLYGLVASWIAERTRELGIRVALGATSSQAALAASAPGVLLGAVGIGTGLAIARIGATAWRAVVWGVPVTDSVTFAAVATVMFAVVVVSSLLPALRIVRLSPIAALRS